MNITWELVTIIQLNPIVSTSYDALEQYVLDII